MRLRFLPFVVMLASCRAACGLEELDGVGGGGAGAAGGAATTDVTSVGAGGEGGGVSAGGGGEGGGGAEVAVELCRDGFRGTEPARCLQVAAACDTSSGGGGGGNRCPGSAVVDSDILTITPDPSSGFWNGWPSVYVHNGNPVQEGEQFIARTRVRTLRAGAVDLWPAERFQLAGLVVSTSTDATTADNWFKAEYGTLVDGDTRGMRTARRMGGDPFPEFGDERVVDSIDDGAPTPPPSVEVAVCRTDDGRVHGFYKSVNESWTPVGPTAANNPPLGGDVFVGLVAASGNDPADLLAEFDYFQLYQVPSFANEGACLTWLQDSPLFEP